MCALGFDHYIEPLTLYLHKYRETTKCDRNLNTNDTSDSSSTTTNIPTTQTFNQTIINVPSSNGNIVVSTAALPQSTNETTLFYQNGTQRFQL